MGPMRCFRLGIVAFAALGASVKLPRSRREPSSRLVAEAPLEPEWKLPYLDVSLVEPETLERLKRGIDTAGSWWAHVGDSLFTPVANLVDTSEETSLMEESVMVEGRNLSSKVPSEGETIEGYYVAIGGSKSTLPQQFKSHHVGGRDPYHILYMPNVTTLAFLEKAAENQGIRRTFHSLIKLKRGFTPITRFVSSGNYKSPLSENQKQLERETVSKLTSSVFEQHLKGLINSFKTRSVYNTNRVKVADYLLSKFKENKNLVACKQPLSVGSLQAYNVLAFAFSSNPDAKFVCVGAHYDSRPFTGNAPGAEDNGSGVAALLSIAQLLDPSRFDSKNHIVFAAFTGEEEGLYGSNEFVRESGSWGNECEKLLPKFTGENSSFELASIHDDLNGAIIMDEVGWASEKLKEHTVTFESREFAESLMEHLYDSSNTHNSGLTVMRSLHPFGSDHMPFLDKNLQAVLTINGNDEEYPYYHKATDTIENVNMELGAKIARMNFGAMIRLAHTTETSTSSSNS